MIISAHCEIRPVASPDPDHRDQSAWLGRPERLPAGNSHRASGPEHHSDGPRPGTGQASSFCEARRAAVKEFLEKALKKEDRESHSPRSTDRGVAQVAPR